MHVGVLRSLTRLNNVMSGVSDKSVLGEMWFHLIQDRRFLGQWARSARKNLDVAECAGAAARPKTLPQALGGGVVAEEPVTAKEHTAPESSVAA